MMRPDVRFGPQRHENIVHGGFHEAKVSGIQILDGLRSQVRIGFLAIAGSRPPKSQPLREGQRQRASPR